MLIAILPLIYFVASMRERMKAIERKLGIALKDYEVLRDHLWSIGIDVSDPRDPSNAEEE